jgi:lipopolysaccharide biosynthesis glycosyltransferase
MTLKVFIGMDERQPLAYNVCRASIERHAGGRLQIEPLRLKWLPIIKRGLTDFTFSRYLCPHLCGYEGSALFLDADMIVRADVHELEALAPQDAPVSVVKGKLRLEWPSMMFFRNALCRALTPETIDNGKPETFEWAQKIGELPRDWNHCVGYDEPNPSPKLIHYTQGIPCWPETEDCEHAEAWREEHRHANGTVSWHELMGRSVHAKHVVRRLHAAGKGKSYPAA